MALIALYKADLEIQAWQTFIVYQGLNLLTAGVVMFGNKIIPALNKFSLFYLQIGWLVVLVTVVACAPTHRDSEFVFRTWINKTGWQNNGITFITGLVNPLYSLGGLDGVTHITEEMPNVCLLLSYNAGLRTNQNPAFEECTPGYCHNSDHRVLHWSHLSDQPYVFNPGF
jgi:hypothetical protein